jgi:hypothetical protein
LRLRISDRQLYDAMFGTTESRSQWRKRDICVCSRWQRVRFERLAGGKHGWDVGIVCIATVFRAMSHGGHFNPTRDYRPGIFNSKVIFGRTANRRRFEASRA